MKFDGSQINLLVALLGGLGTFFASCLLPLVPAYLAYLTGLNSSFKGQKDKSIRKELTLNGLLFTLGFIFTFVLLGATANTLGRTLNIHRATIQKLGGILFIILGAFILEIIKPMALFKELKLKPPKDLTKWKEFNSFLVGITFGFAWTPCIGPVLAVILFWASQAASLWQGIGLLFAYGLGLGIPFMAIAIGFEYIAPKLSKAAKIGKKIQHLSGAIVVLTGILLITGKIEILSIALLRFLGLDEYSI